MHSENNHETEQFKVISSNPSLCWPKIVTDWLIYKIKTTKYLFQFIYNNDTILWTVLNARHRCTMILLLLSINRICIDSLNHWTHYHRSIDGMIIRGQRVIITRNALLCSPFRITDSPLAIAMLFRFWVIRFAHSPVLSWENVHTIIIAAYQRNPCAMQHAHRQT